MNIPRYVNSIHFVCFKSYTSAHSSKDSFSNVNRINGIHLNRKYMICFDRKSLFSKVPLEETMDNLWNHANRIDFSKKKKKKRKE